ncbi:hypothetical protein SSX86_010720 [Deinandra increscens subsp. villosa]|uniref:Large ribosomal subunit protein bL32c n=1 Tax=Deinandra increscens subsp. villosa TaxID=3103831 RepID=A0AAP0GI22_9ASTR
MAVPKKRTSISKKRIRKNIWKRKGYAAALKALSLGKSLSTGNSKSFFVRQTNNLIFPIDLYNNEQFFFFSFEQAAMVKSVDTLLLGSSARASRFESEWRHAIL